MDRREWLLEQLGKDRVNHEIIEELIALDEAYQQPFFSKQREIFNQYSKELVAKLEVASREVVQRQDIMKMAHSLKGSTSSFGAEGIAADCDILENKLKDLSDDAIRDKINHIKKMLELFLEYLSLLPSTNEKMD